MGATPSSRDRPRHPGAVRALTGGALLRVFGGLGRPAPEDPHSARAEGVARDDGTQAEGEVPLARVPALLTLPAGLLVGASLVWGLAPGVTAAAGRAAARFVATGASAALVLDGRPLPPVTSPVHGPGLTGWVYAALSVAGAAGIALAALAGARDRAPRAGLRALQGLRALHSGRPGDYAAFTAFGVAVLGALVAIAIG